MSPEAIFTVDAKASCCVLRSLALIKYTFRRWGGFANTSCSLSCGKGEHTEAYEIGRLLLACAPVVWQLTSRFRNPGWWAPQACPPSGYQAVERENILVRNLWPDIIVNSCRFEQSFSPDGSKTWELNWVATDTRIKDESDGMALGTPQ